MADQKTRITTPVGRAKYPHLHQPTTRFDPDGVFETGLILDEDDFAPMKEQIDAALEEWFEEVKSEWHAKGGKARAAAKGLTTRTPYGPVYDEEGDEVPGKVEIKAKRKHKVTSKKTGKTYKFEVKVFDGKGKRMVNVPVGSGSLIRCIVELRPWAIPKDRECGVTLDLQQVQVKELVTFEAGGSQFDDLEDAYEYDEADSREPEANTGTNEEDSETSEEDDDLSDF